MEVIVSSMGFVEEREQHVGKRIDMEKVKLKCDASAGGCESVYWDLGKVKNECVNRSRQFFSFSFSRRACALGLGEKTNVEVICGHADKLFERCFNNSDLQNASKVYLSQQKIPYSNEDIDGHCKWVLHLIKSCRAMLLAQLSPSILIT
jgi:hypothetical protein